MSEYENLPDKMKAAQRWLVWRREKKPGADKPLKVPYYVNGKKRSGEQNSPDDLAKLATFEHALGALQSGRFDGLGFACGADGTGNYWQAIDLDKLSQRPSLALLAESLPSYTETSPSGDGIHAVGYGRRFDMLKSNETGIEAFCPTQFITVTAECSGLGEITCLADYVETVLRPLHSPAPTPQATRTHATGKVAEGGRDNWLTSMAGTLRRRGLEPEAIEGALRAINASMCDPPLPEADVARIARSIGRKPAGDLPTAPTLRPVSLAGVMMANDEEWPCVMAYYLPRRVVTLLGGHGGVGKSMLALIIGAHVAARRPWGPLAVEGGRVVYLSFEDEAEVVLGRLRRIIDAYALPAHGVIAELQVFDGSDGETEMAIEAPGGLEFTPLMGVVSEAVRGASLVIIDNASDTYGGNENERRQVRRFVRRLARDAKANDAAVLLLAHVDKLAAKGNGKGNNYSGSTQWHNSARSRLALIESEESGIVLQHEKHSYTDGHDPIPLQRGYRGVLFPVAPEVAAADKAARDAVTLEGDAAAVFETMATLIADGATIPTAESGQRTTWHVLNQAPELPERLRGRAGKDRVKAAVLANERAGRIRRETYRTADRKDRERWALAQSKGRCAA